uniref:hypothetical protein n=1 Tax=Pseudomonas sp. 69_B TaxID=2813563 RepID=UPI001AA00082
IKDSIPSLDFNTLHQNAGTNEPLLSEHRYSWPHAHCSSESENLTQVHLSNNALLFLKKANSYEAPLSPSAYRGYLNYRNQHFDSTIPPSPPVDQEEINYGKKDFNDNPGVRIIKKRIHILKKKIKQFEQDFEKEHGYRPSLEQKINSEIANSYIKELNKLRKDLKELKGDSHLI